MIYNSTKRLGGITLFRLYISILLNLLIVLIFAIYSFAAEISEKDVNFFLTDWFTAQNSGLFSKYAAMYSKDFVGIRRSGINTRKFDHDAWLKDRQRMFKKKMRVTSNVPEIKLTGKTVSVKFEQTWESGTYKDRGDKVLDLVLENGKLKITREEMLSSQVISTSEVEDSEISTITTGTTPNGAGKFTSVKDKDCWNPKGYIPKHFDLEEYTKECQGQKQWRLFKSADSERSWLVIANGMRLWSMQNEINGSDGRYSFGQAQDLGSLARVEWRIKPDGTPFALIFQVQATDPDSTDSKLNILYRYYAIRLSKGIPLFCGAVKTKAEARNIADTQKNCSPLEELKASQ